MVALSIRNAQTSGSKTASFWYRFRHVHLVRVHCLIDILIILLTAIVVNSFVKEFILDYKTYLCDKQSALLQITRYMTTMLTSFNAALFSRFCVWNSVL